MRSGRLVGLLAASFVAIAAVVGLSAPLRGLQEVSFPHELHERLFPVCTGCHEGVPLGNQATYYPEPTACATCHDGVLEVRVAWQGPEPRNDNLRFEHARHDEALTEAGDPPQACASCHVQPGGGRMAVTASPRLATCFGCHAHQATAHQVDARCETCHVPLAETDFDRERIASIEPPPDHDDASFLASGHGRLVREQAGRCATCHVQQRCTACHVDTSLDAIASFPAAPPGMDLPPVAAHYPVPESHAATSWVTSHGVQASRTACATCHTSDDCASCHLEPLPAVVADLPARADVSAPGAHIAARAPDSHESAFFMQTHATLAASGDATCTTCHQESFCVSCHDGPVGGGYHPRDFLSQHTAAAFGRDAECSSCHNTAVFCRECHVGLGLVGVGRLGPGYHDDGPVWLLRHGQAARQNLESCASCHRQVDCTQCHGVLGAFKVSPHSASFDAERAWARSPRTCLACHVDGNPLTRSGP